MVWAEADALLMLVLIVIALPVVAIGRYFEQLRRLIVCMALALATVQLVIWLYGTLVPSQMMPLRMTLTTFYQSESVFVGPMPDGAFRVFWIATLWCLLAIFWLPLSIRPLHWRLLGYTILAGSLIASYSRALWIAVALGATIALVERYRRHGLGMLLALTLVIAALAMAGQIEFISSRMASLTSGEVSVSDRWEQLGALSDRWRELPWFGTGYGGTALVLRSEEAPFSYELVPVALFMKLGVVGMSGLALFWVLVAAAVRRLGTSAPAETASFIGGCVSLLVFASSNPVFLNFVGMAVFGCLLFQITVLPDTVTVRTSTE
jgi:hypothetical protein